MNTVLRPKLSTGLLQRARAVPNPYLDEAAPLLGPSDFKTEMTKLRSGNVMDLVALWEGRRSLTVKYAWAVPNAEALAAIAHFARGSVVEIGAGTGYWASLLSHLCTSVVAFDREPPEPERAFLKVNKGGPSNAAAYPDRALFLCWPPYDDMMAAEALWYYQGSRVVYVGEGRGGCTANDAFYDELDNGFELIAEVDLPQWYSINDSLSLWERKRA